MAAGRPGDELRLFRRASFPLAGRYALATRYRRRASAHGGGSRPRVPSNAEASVEFLGRRAAAVRFTDRWGRRSTAHPRCSKIALANSNQLQAPALVACTIPLAPPAMSSRD